MNDIAAEALRNHLADAERRADIDKAASRIRTRCRKALNRLAE
jgi:hypothetical protein